MDNIESAQRDRIMAHNYLSLLEAMYGQAIEDGDEAIQEFFTNWIEPNKEHIKELLDEFNREHKSPAYVVSAAEVTELVIIDDIDKDIGDDLKARRYYKYLREKHQNELKSKR